ncbi:MAG: hypothetical protein IJN42_05935, partial [Clostridia bacterium]|nr:hypothetical protein [Clostridia bacterium]
IVGWLAYLIFVLVRFIQVFNNGKLLAGRMWIQFLYSTIALVLVYTMLFSFGYGIIGSRTAFHKASAYADGTQMYNNVSATEGELSETLVYLIDKLNTVVVNDAPNQNIVFLAKNGASQ